METIRDYILETTRDYQTLLQTICDFYVLLNTIILIYLFYICDQICQKGSYTRTVSRHTFRCHLLATSMHQQDMCLLLLKVEQSAFTQAFFSSLSGIHECSGSLEMAPSSFGKQTAGCESPHDWLMSLAMDLAAVCVTCGGENGTNDGHVPVLSEDVAFAHHFVATHPPTL